MVENTNSYYLHPTVNKKTNIRCISSGDGACMSKDVQVGEGFINRGATIGSQLVD